jgi:hypothetical protein
VTDILTVDGSPRPSAETNGADRVVWSWTGSQIPNLIRSPELRSAYDRWMRLVEKKLPRLNELLDTGPIAALNDGILFLRLPNDFLFLHHGVASAKLIGANLAGKLLSERDTPVARALKSVFTKSADLAEPFYTRNVSSVGTNQSFFVEQLILPIAADEQRQVSFLLNFTAPLDDKNEVLKAIFDRSQIGMIAAASSHDTKGKLQDGRILLINAKAKTILRLSDPPPIHTVRDLGLWFSDGALWTKVGMKTENNLTHFHYRDSAGRRDFRVTIEPWEQFVLFSFMEMSPPN